MFSLKNKKALITGASGAIGAAIATKLHEQGAYVALSGTRAHILEEHCQSLEQSIPLPCALQDEEATSLPRALENPTSPAFEAQ